MQFLVDTGASQNFIKKSLADELKLKKKGERREMRLADGRMQSDVEKIEANIRVENWSEMKEQFYAANIQYEAILGLPWIQQNKAMIHAGEEEVEVKIRDTTVTKNTQMPIPFVSGKETLNAVKQGEEVFIIHLTTADTEEKADKKEDARVEVVLDEFKDRFEKDLPPGLPPHREVDFHVTLEENAIPPSASPYRHSPVENEEIRRQVKTMLERGFIRPSISEYAAPIIVIKKKDGGMRMCIDYQALNKVTKSDRYPLPRIDDLLDKLAGSKYFTKLDLLSGYWQLRVKEGDEHKLAFVTQDGLFEPLVLPFGVKGGPSVFQRMVNTLFVNEKSVLVYLHDILIHLASEEEHLKDL